MPQCVFLFVGPTCRTLRTSPAASTMKCIAWGASTRITRWWLMPTVSQNIISPPTRCRRRLPPSQRNSFVLRLWCSATVLQLHSNPLHSKPPAPPHRVRKTQTPARGTSLSVTFGGWMDGLCQFIASWINPLSIADRERDFYLLTVNICGAKISASTKPNELTLKCLKT